MKIPEICKIPSDGIWRNRNVAGVFLRRHNSALNLHAIKSGIERYSQDQNSSLFLVEGHSNYPACENKFLREHEKNTGVKVVDPIVNPFTESVSDLANVCKAQAANSVLVFDMLSGFIQDEESLPQDIDLDNLIRQCTESVAQGFGVHPSGVRNEYSTLFIDSGLSLEEKLKILLQTRQRLIDVSNVQSRERLLQLLDTNDKQNIFIVAGGEHKTVFNSHFNEQISASNKRFAQATVINTDNLSSNEQFLFLRKATRLNHIETLAAGFRHPQPRINVLDIEVEELDRKGLTNWEKFEIFEGRMNQGNRFVQSRRPGYMLRFLANAEPQPLSSKQYSKSTLMKFALGNFPNDNFFAFSFAILNMEDGVGFWFNYDTESAYILRVLVEKIGDSLQDEVEILAKLLTAKNVNVRLQGAYAVQSTSKHKWGKDSQNIWTIYNAARASKDPEIIRKVNLALISANPSYFFLKFKNSDEYIFYRGKDTEFENILIACTQESDPKIRSSAFNALGIYEGLHHIENPQMENVLIKGIENDDENVVFAISHRLETSRIANPKVLPFLIKKTDDSNLVTRNNALLALKKYLDKEKPYNSSDIYNSELFPIARKHFKDADEDIRANAIDLYGFLLTYRDISNVQKGDVDTLIDLALHDSRELVKSNATYALSHIVLEDLKRIPENQKGVVRGLCMRFENCNEASDREKEIISEALAKLENISEARKRTVVRRIRDPKVAGEVTKLFGDDKVAVQQLRQSLKGLNAEIAQAKKEIDKLMKQKQVLKSSLTEKRKLVRSLVKQLRDAKDEIKKLKNKEAKKHLARLIISSGSMIIPHCHFLGISTDLVNVFHDASGYVDAVTLPKVVRDFISQN